jgi:hypothetical protein
LFLAKPRLEVARRPVLLPTFLATRPGLSRLALYASRQRNPTLLFLLLEQRPSSVDPDPLDVTKLPKSP